MNFNQLRFVQAVAADGSFSRAAERCCVTQPTLSNAIGQLEEELGGRLFHRTTRSVSLTPFGRELLANIEAVLEARDELRAAAEAYHRPPHRLVRIGLSPLIDAHLFNRLLTPFTDANPQVKLFFKQCFLDDMSERLQRGTVDVAIVPTGNRWEGTHGCDLYDEPLYFLPRHQDGKDLPPGPACGPEQWSADEVILTRGCGLSDAIAALFAREGVTLRPYPGQALSYRIVEDWAGLGIGAGILPRSQVSADNREARAMCSGDGANLRVSYRAHWLPTAPEREHLARFVEHLKQRVPALATAGAA